MRKLTILILLFPFVVYSQTGPIQVHLKSGQALNTRYAYLFNTAGFEKPYVRINDRRGEKVTIDLVSYVDGTDQNGTFRYFKPIRFQAREIWGERTYESDRIEIYYTDFHGDDWGSVYKYKYFMYTMDNSGMKKVSYASVKKDIEGNTESMLHLKKGNSIRITQLLLYTAGTSLIISGVASGLSDPENSKIPVGFIAGAITLSIPFFLNNAKQKHFVNALEAFK
jgi:hypothetical protein